MQENPKYIYASLCSAQLKPLFSNLCLTRSINHVGAIINLEAKFNPNKFFIRTPTITTTLIKQDDNPIRTSPRQQEREELLGIITSHRRRKPADPADISSDDYLRWETILNHLKMDLNANYGCIGERFHSPDRVFSKDYVRNMARAIGLTVDYPP